MHLSIVPWPFGYKVACVIRDDDACYFTPPYKIQKIYEPAWRQGFKVSLGVVPRLKTIDDLCVPPQYRGRLTLHSLYDNRELVEYLKEKQTLQQIDVAQHGYTHEKFDGAPEFYIKDSSEIRRRLKAGRGILEGCLPVKISVFIAPWNSVSKQAWKVLRDEGMDLCRSVRVYTLLRNTPWSLDNVIPLARILTRKIFVKNPHPLTGGIMRFPSMIELYHAVDIWWSNLNYPRHLRWAKKTFMKVMALNGLFCILNHYWAFFDGWKEDVENQEMLHSFYDLLRFINSQHVWRTTLTDVVDWIRKLDKIEIRVKRGEVTLKSPHRIQGVTIKADGHKLVPVDGIDVKVKEEKDATYIIYKQLEPGETKVALIS